MFKIITWNVNSISVRIKHVEELLMAQKPDLLVLQETKCIDEKFPYDSLDNLYYNSYVYGQAGGRNGVAILSKNPLEEVRHTFAIDDGEARFIQAIATFREAVFKIACVYVPNGRDPESEHFERKMKFFSAMYEYMAEHNNENIPLVLAGDLNVAPCNIDVYNPKALDGHICFHIKERQWFRRFEDLGMQDAYRMLNPGVQEFSWWDHRQKGWEYGRGMRIDHILLSPSVAKYAKEAYILSEFRAKSRPSDHAPVVCVLE